MLAIKQEMQNKIAKGILSVLKCVNACYPTGDVEMNYRKLVVSPTVWVVLRIYILKSGCYVQIPAPSLNIST